jgi:non-ribosomal peptide synthetase component E (peptide arylation enzyme)
MGVFKRIGAKTSIHTPELISEYWQAGYWQDVTTVDLCERNSREYADTVALIDSRSRLTWFQVEQYSDRIALALLEFGLDKNDVLFLQSYNCVEFFLVRLACEKAGIVCAIAAATFRQAEVEPILRHLKAKAIVIPWRYRNFDYFDMVLGMLPELSSLKHILIIGDEAPDGAISLEKVCREPREKRYPSDYLQKYGIGTFETSWIYSTSGTTGLPKCLSNFSCACIGLSRQFAKQLKLSHDDIIGIFGPVTWGGANDTGYYATALVADKAIFLERFTPEQACPLIEKERITGISMLPAQLAQLASYTDLNKHDLSSLRFIHIGGAFMSPHLGAEAERKLGCRMIQNYGSGETQTITINSLDDPLPVRLETVGKPIDGVDVKIVDEKGRDVPSGEVGEMMVRTPYAPLGFYKDPEATRRTWQDGWVNTGDQAKLDERSNVVLSGRKRDTIIRGGQNIYPAEMENIISQHPKVSEVTVVRMPDVKMGEKACAYVVPQLGVKISFDELISFMRKKRVAQFKLPERLEIMKQLPLAPGGKVDRKRLERDIAHRLEAEGKLFGPA